MKTLILIPGMMCDARLYKEQLAYFSHYHTWVPDICGFDSIEQLAQSILQKAPQSFCLGGLSMGGIVAMEIVRQASSRVDRLCLMDTNPLPEQQEVADKRLPQMEKVGNGQLEQVMRDEMKPNYLFDKNNTQILDLCLDMALSLGSQCFINQSLALMHRPDQRASLQAFKSPTLILQGADDRLCPASRHELMHSLMPHAVYEVIEQAGHLSCLENPQRVNQALRLWLEGS